MENSSTSDSIPSSPDISLQHTDRETDLNAEIECLLERDTIDPTVRNFKDKELRRWKKLANFKVIFLY